MLIKLLILLISYVIRLLINFQIVLTGINIFCQTVLMTLVPSIDMVITALTTKKFGVSTQSSGTVVQKGSVASVVVARKV